MAAQTIHAAKRRRIEAEDAGYHSSGSSFSENEANASTISEKVDVVEDAGASDGYVESDGDEEMEETAEGQNRPKAGLKRIREDRKHQLLDRASRSELMMAGETSKSGLFKLQIDELLAGVRPKYQKHMPRLEKVLRKLKEIIELIPKREALSISDAESFIQKNHSIVVPFPDPRPPNDAKYTFTYQKPVNINIVGSFALETGTKKDSPNIIDMAITMPPELFQEKDYLNYRYFYKRALYLACVAAGVQDAQACDFKVSFEYQDGNSLKPVISILPSGNGEEYDFSSTGFGIRIITAIPQDLFAKSKTYPNRNSIRPPKDQRDESTKLEATPFYNSSLRSEATVASFHGLFSTIISECSSFKDSCALGQVWLHQRGFNSSISGGGFGHFEWAAICANLLRNGDPNGRPLLSSGYSSYQLFRAMLQFLASKDLTKPFILQSDLALTKGGSPVFFDGIRGINILYKMSPFSYKLLRQESRTLLEMLNDSVHDYFDAAFIYNVNEPLLRFDVLVKVPLPSDILSSMQLLTFYNKLHNVLSRGLTDRVQLIHISLPSYSQWKTSVKPPNHAYHICIEIRVDPEHVHRTVDHGPAAEDSKAAASFRKFWGEKSELRRFKDGSILESLIWTKNDNGHSVLEQMILYLISRHIGEDIGKSLSFINSHIDRTLLPGKTASRLPSAFQPMMEAFRTLEKDLRDLEDLPLQFRQISASSPQLRYSSFTIPISVAHDSHLLATPADVTIQFEGSTRWPDDLVAVQRTKFAFLQKIADSMVSTHPGVTARVGIENQFHPTINNAFLDIVYPSGAFFRLRIFHELEPVLLNSILANKTLSTAIRTEAALALSTYKRLFIHSPAHTTAMQHLCMRFPLLSPTIRALKRFFSSHILLSPSHLPHELIELIAAYPFLHPYPYTVPSSLSTAFLRALGFIARWRWQSIPLLMSFGDNLTQDDVHAASLRFRAWRNLDPSMTRTVLFIATKLDLDGTAWTQQGPDRVVAARMVWLAKSALAVIKLGSQSDDFTRISVADFSSIFAPALRDFDFLLHLSETATSFTRNKRQDSKSKFKNLQLQHDASGQVTQDGLPPLNPIPDLLGDLRTIFDPHVIFFWSDGQPVIAGLWNRLTVGEARNFKLSVGWNSEPLIEKRKRGHKPVDDEEMRNEKGNKEEDARIQINKDAILREIASIAGDLVSRVEVF